jgi:hypothetical protein
VTNPTQVWTPAARIGGQSMKLPMSWIHGSAVSIDLQAGLIKQPSSQSLFRQDHEKDQSADPDPIPFEGKQAQHHQLHCTQHQYDTKIMPERVERLSAHQSKLCEQQNKQSTTNRQPLTGLQAACQLQLCKAHPRRKAVVKSPAWVCAYTVRTSGTARTYPFSPKCRLVA